MGDLTQQLQMFNIDSTIMEMLWLHVAVMLCNVWLAESCRAPALWRHDHNVDDQNMVVLSIVWGWLAMLTEENLPSKYNVNEMKSI